MCLRPFARVAMLGMLGAETRPTNPKHVYGCFTNLCLKRLNLLLDALHLHLLPLPSLPGVNTISLTTVFGRQGKKAKRLLVSPVTHIWIHKEKKRTSRPPYLLCNLSSLVRRILFLVVLLATESMLEVDSQLLTRVKSGVG